MTVETILAQPGPGEPFARARDAADQATLVARKIRELARFDVLGMDEVVAVSAWGRSASLLLTSFLDGHDHVVMLPGLHGERIWRFFDRYAELPLEDRLLAYPRYSEQQGRPFHYGDFIVAEADYRAAVTALMAVHGDAPAEVLAAPRTFFQFLHTAYALAQGKSPATPRPLMVYFQHNRDEALADRLIRDFPKARFLHTVRHPIACFRSSVERHLALSMSDGQIPQPSYFKPVLAIATELLTQDRPHPGAEARTMAVRFEDMHLAPRDTMRSVAGWLGLPWRRTLEASTFNGVPYLMERGDSDWVGTQPTQAEGPLRNVSFADRMLLFALFHENFAAWGYPHPALFRHGWLRRLAVMAFRIVPMSMELTVARASWRVQVRPALDRGAYAFVLRLTARWAACHGAAARVAAAELRRRIGRSAARSRGPGLLRILHPAEPTDEGATVARRTRFDSDRLASILLDRAGVERAAEDRPMDRELMGRAASLLDPLAALIRDHVLAAEALHAADVPLPVLVGRSQARVWAYVRDDRPFRGAAAPAVALFHSADRAPAHRQDHLARFSGFLQTHAGPAFERPGEVIPVACWARCGLKFCELVEFTGATRAAEALERIAAIQAIETRARFLPPAERLALRAAARPLVEEFFAWADGIVAGLDGASALAGAFRHVLARRVPLSRFLDHGCLEFDNGAVAPVLSRLAWDAAAWSAPGDTAGDLGAACATVYTVIATAQMNGLDERAYLRDVLARLGKPRRDDGLAELLPWCWIPEAAPK
jgi:hypothetical protein